MINKDTHIFPITHIYKASYIFYYCY